MIQNIDIDVILKKTCPGNQAIPPDLISDVSDLISKCIEYSNPKYCYRIFDIEHISETEIKLSNSNYSLQGNHISSHLRNASKVAIFAATLGVSFDNYLKRLQLKEVYKAFILDICANEYIENFCDFIQEDIRKSEYLSSYLFLPRFSPGYGDFPISSQRELLHLLDAQRKIGLTCTSSYIMIPKKSVTAIVGLVDGSISKTPNDKPVCDICQFNRNCELKKGGLSCGRKRIHER